MSRGDSCSRRLWPVAGGDDGPARSADGERCCSTATQHSTVAMCDGDGATMTATWDGDSDSQLTLHEPRTQSRVSSHTAEQATRAIDPYIATLPARSSCNGTGLAVAGSPRNESMHVANTCDTATHRFEPRDAPHSATTTLHKAAAPPSSCASRTLGFFDRRDANGSMPTASWHAWPYPQSNTRALSPCVSRSHLSAWRRRECARTALL